LKRRETGSSRRGGGEGETTKRGQDLDVLQREVLGLRAAVELVTRLDARDEAKQVADG